MTKMIIRNKKDNGSLNTKNNLTKISKKIDNNFYKDNKKKLKNIYLRAFDLNIIII